MEQLGEERAGDEFCLALLRHLRHFNHSIIHVFVYFRVKGVHHRDFRVLHSIDLVAIRLEGVQIAGLEVECVVGRRGQHVVFGRLREVIRRQAVGVSHALEHFVEINLGQDVILGVVDLGHDGRS